MRYGWAVLVSVAAVSGCGRDPGGATESVTGSAFVAASRLAASVSTSSSPPASCREVPADGPLYDAPIHRDLEPSPATVELALRSLHERAPCSLRLHELGRSHRGRPLLALEIGRGSAAGKATVLLAGVHHGDEPLSAAFVLDAARYLSSRRGRDHEVDRWLDELRIWLVPVVNPDGLTAHVEGLFAGSAIQKPGRKNARDNDGDGRHGPNDGVDLNRNYPFKWGFLGEQGSTRAHAVHTFRGPEPGSEPETRAMMQLARSEVFAASISYHVGGVALLVPYTIDGVRSPEPNEAWAVARELAARMTKHPDALDARTFPVRRNLYAVDGTDQDWHRAEHGTEAFILEGALRGSAGASDLRRRAAVVEAVRGSWMALFDRALDGPLVEGQILDREGRPVVAEVHLSGVRLKEGESWRSRCRDGYFARWAATSGPHQLRVRLADGRVVAERSLEVVGRTRLSLRLDELIAPPPCPPAPTPSG